MTQLTSANNNNNNSNNAQSNEHSTSDSYSTNSSQAQLSVFCREVRNLLRSKPNCLIPFSKFVPAYHNHYGRQCCVYQFGYTKLIDLLESIPDVVQIVGEGTGRYITLTRREQIKRFASDLIKVVKAQPGKKLKLSDFAAAYEQVLGRVFRVEDYGTRDINVLLAEIWEGTINIIPIRRSNATAEALLWNEERAYISLANSAATSDCCSTESWCESMVQSVPMHSSNTNNSGSSAEQSASTSQASSTSTSPSSDKPYITYDYPDAWFEIPRRERSEREIRRTKYFIADVIELLSSMPPSHSVPFSKFIPSYHYYFNTQCKVSVFGFSKLIDLFESISPHVVEIVDMGVGEEKVIKLAQQHIPRPTQAAIDCGPTREELAALEDEWRVYELSRALRADDDDYDDNHRRNAKQAKCDFANNHAKHSNRMAAAIKSN